MRGFITGHWNKLGTSNKRNWHYLVQKILLTLNIQVGKVMSTRSGSHTSQIQWQRGIERSLCSSVMNEIRFSVKRFNKDTLINIVTQIIQHYSSSCQELCRDEIVVHGSREKWKIHLPKISRTNKISFTMLTPQLPIEPVVSVSFFFFKWLFLLSISAYSLMSIWFSESINKLSYIWALDLFNQS